MVPICSSISGVHRQTWYPSTQYDDGQTQRRQPRQKPAKSSPRLERVQEVNPTVAHDKPGYTYDATVVRWVDGDTVELRVNLGFYITVDAKFRSYGINAPDTGDANWLAAKQRCEALAPSGAAVTVLTYKPLADKYGRFLGTVFTADGTNINQTLVAEGLAYPYLGEGPKPE